MKTTAHTSKSIYNGNPYERPLGTQIFKVGVYLLMTFTAIMFVLSLVGTVYKGGFFDRFTGKIEAISTAFIAVGVYLTFKIFEIEQYSKEAQMNLNLVDKGWRLVNDEIARNYQLCPNFINSLFFDWQKEIMTSNYMADKTKSESVTDDWTNVNYISCLIFQAVEDFLTVITVYDVGSFVWINCFIGFFNSPILIKIWNSQKQNYALKTRLLIDYIILTLKNNKKPITSYEDIDNLTKSIVESNRYNEIINIQNK
jgi:hypothetical protein